MVNQSTFCLSPETRKLMEGLKDTSKSTKRWAWSDENEKIFNSLKEHIVVDCEKEIKRLTSHSDTPLVILSDWSKYGSGFTLYEVTCTHPATWDIRKDDIKVL